MTDRSDHGPIETLRGSITSVGFSSGHQFVIGHWPSTPIGGFADVMWRAADGSRTLIASTEAADYITEIYLFDDRIDTMVTVTDTVGGRGPNRLIVDADPLTLNLTIGRFAIPFPPRPRWITATVERVTAKALLGVNTYGVSPTGVEEWYRTRSVRRVVDGRGSLAGTDLGTLVELAQPMNVGFSEPPRRPTHVRLRVDVRRTPAGDQAG